MQTGKIFSVVTALPLIVVVYFISPLQAIGKTLDEAVARGDWDTVYSLTDRQSQNKQDSSVDAWLRGYATLATGDYRDATSAFSKLDPKNEPGKLSAWATRLSQAHPQSANRMDVEGRCLRTKWQL